MLRTIGASALLVFMIWPVRPWVSQYVVNALEEASKHQAGTSSAFLLTLPCMAVVVFVAVTFVLLFIVLRALQGMRR